MSTSLTVNPMRTSSLQCLSIHLCTYSDIYVRRCSSQCSLRLGRTLGMHHTTPDRAAHACLLDVHTDTHTSIPPLSLTSLHYNFTLHLHTVYTHTVHVHSHSTHPLPLILLHTHVHTNAMCCTSCRNLHRSLKANSNSLFSMTWSNTPGVAAARKRTERKG